MPSGTTPLTQTRPYASSAQSSLDFDITLAELQGEFKAARELARGYISATPVETLHATSA